jgi:hypothetical protein
VSGVMNELSKKLFEVGCKPEEYKPMFITEDHRGCRRVYSEFDWSDNWHCFEYSPEFLRRIVFESPCGLLMKGIDSYSHMVFMGIEWCPENNNSVHRCPFNRVNCELNHEYLRPAIGHKHDIVQCAFHFSDRVYDYENSYEKAWDEFYAMQERKRKEFYSRMKWNPEAKYCQCINWDEIKQNWYASYNPQRCTMGCWNTICVLTGRRLDGKKGNVFYDVKITRICHDGSFWDGEKTINIIKGKKMFDSLKPLPICEAYAKLCKSWIFDREKARYHRELFFNKDMIVEVLNVRAEYRESRDLLQDLRDIQEGIKIIHASYEKKESAQAKRERRKKYQEDKRRRREKRNIAKWKRLLKDEEYLKQYVKEHRYLSYDEDETENLKDIDWDKKDIESIAFYKEWAEKELKKRGIEREPEQLTLL